jgi:hypothetical protein
MYYDVESVKSDPIISHEYPSGNCFDHILDIMRVSKDTYFTSLLK